MPHICSRISQRGWVQCVYPVFHVKRKQTQGWKTMWNGPKIDKRSPPGHNFHRQSRLRLLLTGASRQLDVWDFPSSAASGWQQTRGWQQSGWQQTCGWQQSTWWQQRHFWGHCRSIQLQLILRPQKVQGGHSPTLQPPASHAEHNCLNSLFGNFAVFAVSSICMLLLLWSNQLLL